jgi:hypothetical protein
VGKESPTFFEFQQGERKPGTSGRGQAQLDHAISWRYNGAPIVRPFYVDWRKRNDGDLAHETKPYDENCAF